MAKRKLLVCIRVDVEVSHKAKMNTWASPAADAVRERLGLLSIMYSG